MNTDQKWAAYELINRDGEGDSRIIGAAMHDCDDKTFALLMTAFPQKMQAAMEAGKQRKAQVESTLDSALKTLAEHPDLFVRFGNRAKYLLQKSERRKQA